MVGPRRSVDMVLALTTCMLVTTLGGQPSGRCRAVPWARLLFCVLSHAGQQADALSRLPQQLLTELYPEDTKPQVLASLTTCGASGGYVTLEVDRSARHSSSELVMTQVLIEWCTCVFAYLNDADFEDGMRQLLATKGALPFELNGLRC